MKSHQFQQTQDFGQNNILEMVIQGCSLENTLDTLAKNLESISIGTSYCSIMLVDKTGEYLVLKSGPSLPEEYRNALGQVRISAGSGSCGTSVFRRKNVIVEDIENDPLWADFRDLALKYDLRACWSVPIFDSTRNVLGTFAYYYKHPRNPSAGEILTLESAAHYAGLAIQRSNMAIPVELPNPSTIRVNSVYQQLFAVVSDAIIIVDVGLNSVIDVNDAALELYGYSREEFLKLSPEDICINPEKSREAIAHVKPGQLKKFPLWFHKKKDGTKFPLEMSVGTLSIDQKVLFYTVVRDISEQIQKEQNLFKEIQKRGMQERKPETFSEFPLQNPNPVMKVGFDHTILFANNSACELLMAWNCRVGDPVPSEFQTPIKKILEQKLPKDFEIKINNRSYSFRMAVLEENKEINLYGAIVTQSREIGQAVYEERQNLYHMLEHLPVAFHLQAPDYSVPYANKMFRDRFGSPENMKCYDLMQKRTRPCEVCSPFKIFETGETISSVWTAPEGETYLTVMTPFRDLDGSPLVMEMAIDISEQERSKKIAVEAQKAAEKANRAKSEFLSSMSHELRTPMNAILGFAQLMEIDGDHLPQTHTENVKQILSAGKHLLDLINEILDLAKIDSGKIQLKFEGIPLGTFLSGVLETIDPWAKKQNIRILNQVPQDLAVKVRADSMRLKQVLFNLVSNAVKYNGPGGSVTLSYEKAGPGKIRINVIDTGRGIEEKDFQTIFDPFNRLKVDISEIEGTGIGLSITKRLIELMGGRLLVKSKMGEGSTFSFELPVTNESEAFLQQSIQPGKGDHHQTPSKPRHTVLYIEDNATNLELVSQIIKMKNGIRLVNAPNGKKGVDLARDQKPQLILMDLHLPDMDGFETFTKIQSDENMRDIPVVALTADALEVDKKKALQMGFKDYLVKPIDVSLFLKVLDIYLT